MKVLVKNNNKVGCNNGVHMAYITEDDKIGATCACLKGCYGTDDISMYEVEYLSEEEANYEVLLSDGTIITYWEYLIRNGLKAIV